LLDLQTAERQTLICALCAAQTLIKNGNIKLRKEKQKKQIST